MNSKGSPKVIAIHQPNYLPWLGYFYKIYQSDVFVFLDDAQFSNQGMHNYAYIKTKNGSLRLKYPVQQSLGDKIIEVRSKDELGWKEKHISILESSYSDATFFKQIINDYKELIYQDYSNIAVLNSILIKFFCSKMGIHTEFLNSSDLGINSPKEEKIIKICKDLDANIYYSGTGAMAYQNKDNFSAFGIDLRYSVFSPFHYTQLWEGFQQNVTALDYFMNCGYNWDRVLESQKANGEGNR